MHIFKVLFAILLFVFFILKDSAANNENLLINPDTDTIEQTDTKKTAYTINRTLNDENFIIEIPPSIIKIYESNLHNPILPINNLFVSPLQLLLLNELTKKVIAVFTEVGLKYWACFSTLESVEKFACFAPWDCYAYLAVDVKQLKEKLPELNVHMEKHGIFFSPLKNIASKKFSFFIKLEPQTFASIVKNYEPTYSDEKIDNLYTAIRNDFRHPRIEIITFTINDSGIKYYVDFLNQSYLKKDQIKSGYSYNHIFPLADQRLNNINIKIPSSPEIIMQQALFKGNFFQLYIIANGTKFNALNIENIRLHREFLILIKNYLSFVFKDEFTGISEIYQKIIESTLNE